MKMRKRLSIVLAFLMTTGMTAFAEESPLPNENPAEEPQVLSEEGSEPDEDDTMPMDDGDSTDSALGITYVVIDNKGQDITDSVNGMDTLVQTTKTRVIAMTEADYTSRIWLDGAGCVFYNPDYYTGEKWMTPFYEMTASNHPDSVSLLFGKEYDMEVVSPDRFVEGQYYTFQGFTYNEAPYSWQVEGADEYVQYGASVYFKYKKGMKLTCCYLMNESENTSLSANVLTVTDWNGKTYYDYGHVPTEDEIVEDCGRSIAEKYGLVNQVQYQIFNQDEQLMHFREICGRFYYDPDGEGDVSLQNVRGLSHLYGMPDGTYTIKEPENVDYAFTDSKVRSFTVQNGADIETVRMINTCNLGKMTLYQYYADEDAPKPIVSYFIRLGAAAKEDVWFKDLGYDEEGVRHYRFTGLVTNQEQPGLVKKVEVTGKTVLDHLPMGMIYTLIDEEYFAGYFGNGQYESYNLHAFFPEIIRQNVFDNSYGLREIFKTDSLTGENTDAVFTTSMSYKSEKWLYDFKHYDTKEIKGKIYENVYEIIGITEAAGESESNHIRTVDGHACLYYPENFNVPVSKNQSGAYRKYTFYPFHFYTDISEIEAKEGYDTFDEVITISDLYKLYWDPSKQEYNNVDVQNFKPMTYELRWQNDPTKPIEIQNDRYPSVTKSVENGSGGSYKFTLFEQNESGEWTRIYDFTVKDGETEFLKPEQRNEDGSTTGYLKEGKKYCVREETSEAYELKTIKAEGEDAQVLEDAEGVCFVFTYSAHTPVNGTFVNFLIPKEPEPTPTPTTTPTPTKKTDVPNTSDGSDITLWGGILFVSLAGVFFAVWQMRGKSGNRQ